MNKKSEERTNNSIKLFKRRIALIISNYLFLKLLQNSENFQIFEAPIISNWKNFPLF